MNKKKKLYRTFYHEDTENMDMVSLLDKKDSKFEKQMENLAKNFEHFSQIQLLDFIKMINADELRNDDVLHVMNLYNIPNIFISILSQLLYQPLNDSDEDGIKAELWNTFLDLFLTLAENYTIFEDFQFASQIIMSFIEQISNIPSNSIYKVYDLIQCAVHDTINTNIPNFIIPIFQFCLNGLRDANRELSIKQARIIATLIPKNTNQTEESNLELLQQFLKSLDSIPEVNLKDFNFVLYILIALSSFAKRGFKICEIISHCPFFLFYVDQTPSYIDQYPMFLSPLFKILNWCVYYGLFEHIPIHWEIFHNLFDQDNELSVELIRFLDMCALKGTSFPVLIDKIIQNRYFEHAGKIAFQCSYKKKNVLVDLIANVSLFLNYDTLSSVFETDIIMLLFETLESDDEEMILSGTKGLINIIEKCLEIDDHTLIRKFLDQSADYEPYKILMNLEFAGDEANHLNDLMNEAETRINLC